MIDKEMIENGLISFDDIIDNLDDDENIDFCDGDLEKLLDNME